MGLLNANDTTGNGCLNNGMAKSIARRSGVKKGSSVSMLQLLEMSTQRGLEIDR